MPCLGRSQGSPLQILLRRTPKLVRETLSLAYHQTPEFGTCMHSKPNKRQNQNAVIQRPATDSFAVKRAPLPEFIQPQLATLVNSIPQGDEWLHEIKFDGYRILCRIENGRAAFLTREAQDWTGRFKALAKVAEKLRADRLLLDGEVVALGPNGIDDFQLLQNCLKQNVSSNLVYYVFDLLHLDGRNIIYA